jgi:hypothetical protein
MQPTEESLEIAEDLLNNENLPGGKPLGMKRSIALAIDAAYQRGKDKVEKERDAALALAAKRGEALEKIFQIASAEMDNVSFHREGQPFESKVYNVTLKSIKDPTPERWIEQQIKRAIAEVFTQQFSGLTRHDYVVEEINGGTYVSTEMLEQLVQDFRKEAGL